MSGVWLLDRMVPLPFRKLRRLGISSRSDGTLGLSRKKWMLSKVISTTCLMPLPRWQVAASTTGCDWPVTLALTATAPALTGTPVLTKAAKPAANIDALLHFRAIYPPSLELPVQPDSRRNP